MNFFGLSPGELILIMLLAMIVLGPEKLPEVAGSIGKWIREFRRATEELTAQFGDENPFTEIQRALNLSDFTEPISLNPPESAAPTPASAETAPPVPTAVSEPAPVPPVFPAVPGTIPQATPMSRDYFTRPPRYPAVVEEWAHGSLPERWNGRVNGHHAFSAAPVDDDWAHGVPVATDPMPESIVAVQSGPTESAAQPDGAVSETSSPDEAIGVVEETLIEADAGSSTAPASEANGVGGDATTPSIAEPARTDGAVEARPGGAPAGGDETVTISTESLSAATLPGTSERTSERKSEPAADGWVDHTAVEAVVVDVGARDEQPVSGGSQRK